MRGSTKLLSQIFGIFDMILNIQKKPEKVAIRSKILRGKNGSYDRELDVEYIHHISKEISIFGVFIALQSEKGMTSF